MNKEDIKFLINVRLKRMEIFAQKHLVLRSGDVREELEKIDKEIAELEKELRKPKQSSTRRKK